MTLVQKTLVGVAILISCIVFIYAYFVRQEYQPPANYCPFTISENEGYFAPAKSRNHSLALRKYEGYKKFKLDILHFKRVQTEEFGFSVFIWDSKIFLLADCNADSLSDFSLSWRSKRFAKENLLLTKISDDEYAHAMHGASYK